MYDYLEGSKAKEKPKVWQSVDSGWVG
jgi:hypothetical protein